MQQCLIIWCLSIDVIYWYTWKRLVLQNWYKWFFNMFASNNTDYSQVNSSLNDQIFQGDFSSTKLCKSLLTFSIIYRTFSINCINAFFLYKTQSKMVSFLWQISLILYRPGFLMFFASLTTMRFHLVLDLVILFHISSNPLTISSSHRGGGLRRVRFQSLRYH